MQTIQIWILDDETILTNQNLKGFGAVEAEIQVKWRGVGGGHGRNSCKPMFYCYNLYTIRKVLMSRVRICVRSWDSVQWVSRNEVCQWGVRRSTWASTCESMTNRHVIYITRQVLMSRVQASHRSSDSVNWRVRNMETRRGRRSTWSSALKYAYYPYNIYTIRKVLMSRFRICVRSCNSVQQETRYSENGRWAGGAHSKLDRKAHV